MELALPVLLVKAQLLVIAVVHTGTVEVQAPIAEQVVSQRLELAGLHQALVLQNRLHLQRQQAQRKPPVRHQAPHSQLVGTGLVAEQLRIPAKAVHLEFVVRSMAGVEEVLVICKQRTVGLDVNLASVFAVKEIRLA